MTRHRPHSQRGPMTTAQALRLAILLLQFEAEEAHMAGNNLWAAEVIKAGRVLAELRGGLPENDNIPMRKLAE